MKQYYFDGTRFIVHNMRPIQHHYAVTLLMITIGLLVLLISTSSVGAQASVIPVTTCYVDVVSSLPTDDTDHAQTTVETLTETMRCRLDEITSGIIERVMLNYIAFQSGRNWHPILD